VLCGEVLAGSQKFMGPATSGHAAEQVIADIRRGGAPGEDVIDGKVYFASINQPIFGLPILVGSNGNVRTCEYQGLPRLSPVCVTCHTR
jgi:hypothetical protein